MADDITWKCFTKRTDDPKLEYLENWLDSLGIPHRRNGHSFHGPVLEVPEERLDEAWALLSEPFFVDGQEVRFDDIPDDHPMFNPFGDA